MTTDDATHLRTHPTPDVSAARLPSLPSTVYGVLLGHIAWLKYAWAAVLAVTMVVVLGAWATSASVSTSTSEQILVGIGRWFFLAAGVTTASTFIPLFVSNGVTRARLSSATSVALVFLSAIATALTAASFVFERLVASGAGWDLLLTTDGPPLDAGTIGTRSLVVVPLLAAHFVSGWLIGLGFYRFGNGLGILLIVPSLIPLVIVDVLLAGPTNMIGLLGAMEGWFEPVTELAAPVSVPVAAVVVAISCVVARELTRRTPVRT